MATVQLKKKPVTKKKVAAKKTSVKKASAKAKSEVIEAVDAVEEAVETVAESVFAKFNQNVKAAQNVAQQVWFAGLGAAGRTYEEVTTRYTQAGEELQSRYAQLKKDREELVEDLVARGEKVQDEAQERIKESRASVEEQIEVAKERLVGLSSKVDIPARLQDLSDRLESLSKDLKKTA